MQHCEPREHCRCFKLFQKKKKIDTTPLQGFTAYCVKKKSPYEPLSTDTPAITSSWVPLVLEERPKRHRKTRD